MTLNAFVTSWLAALPRTLVDALAHLVLAVTLPGAWWFQYVPDIFVLPIWLRSATSGSMLPDGDVELQAHRVMHLRQNVPAGIALYVALALAASSPWVLLHVLLHVMVDRMTHSEEWQ